MQDVADIVVFTISQIHCGFVLLLLGMGNQDTPLF
jgi:hypothetical protein